jgi:hypothetical protein
MTRHKRRTAVRIAAFAALAIAVTASATPADTFSDPNFPRPGGLIRVPEGAKAEADITAIWWKYEGNRILVSTTPVDSIDAQGSGPQSRAPYLGFDGAGAYFSDPGTGDVVLWSGVSRTIKVFHSATDSAPLVLPPALNTTGHSEANDTGWCEIAHSCGHASITRSPQGGFVLNYSGDAGDAKDPGAVRSIRVCKLVFEGATHDAMDKINREMIAALHISAAPKTMDGEYHELDPPDGASPKIFTLADGVVTWKLQTLADASMMRSAGGKCLDK